VPRGHQALESVAGRADAWELAAEHRQNWIGWSGDAVAWSLRKGRVASRLRFEANGGEGRKVLWMQYTTDNQFAEIGAALTRSLRSSPRIDRATASAVSSGCEFGAQRCTRAHDLAVHRPIGLARGGGHLCVGEPGGLERKEAALARPESRHRVAQRHRVVWVAAWGLGACDRLKVNCPVRRGNLATMELPRLSKRDEVQPLPGSRLLRSYAGP
jgi:hypothetical protein